jgi:hypothetical protein
MVQGFWDQVLPIVAQRIHEFSFDQLVTILESACKPFVGKKSVIRILAGFYAQAVRLLGEKGPQIPHYSASVDKLFQIIPVLFHKAEMRQAVEGQLATIAENVRTQKIILNN